MDQTATSEDRVMKGVMDVGVPVASDPFDPGV